MAYTDPTLRTTGDLITAAIWNNDFVNDIKWLAQLFNTAGSKPVFVGYSETKTAPAIASNVLTIDMALGTLFEVSVNANINTMTINNKPASGQLGSFILSLIGDGTARTFTWFASTVIWPGGTAPTRTSVNGKKDIYTYLFWDGGTNIYGFVGGQNF